MTAPPFTVRALYPYESDHPDDLTFQAGQQITVETIEDDEWYSGSYVDGSKSGMFPRNFVEILPDIPHRPKRASQVLPPQPATAGSGAAPSAAGDAAEPQQVPPASSFEEEEDLNKGVEQLNVNQEPGAGAGAGASAVEEDLPTPAPAPAPAESPKEEKEPPRAKSNAFKDRIAAFNMQQNAPLMPQKQQFKNESFVKKPYVAPPPSNYMPSLPIEDKPKPKYTVSRSPDSTRDTHLPPSSSGAAPVVPSASNAADAPHDDTDEERREQQRGEEESVPKMSLKERIAMLHKQQQEEAERMEAAQQKKKTKKKREELERVKSSDSTTSQEPPLAPSAGDEDIESREAASGAPPPVPTTSSASVKRPEAGEHRDLGGVQEEEEGSDEEADAAERRHEHDQNESGEEGSEEEESEDEEDEEEAKRIALRERMAKISGGMGMNLGMLMGGGFPAPGSSGKPKKKKASANKDDQGGAEETVRAAPVPIFPFAAPGTLPPELQRKQAPVEQQEDHADDEFTEEPDEKDVELEREPAPMSPVTGTTHAPPVPPPPPHIPEGGDRRSSGEYSRRLSSESQRSQRSQRRSSADLDRRDSFGGSTGAGAGTGGADIGPIDEVIEDELGDDELTTETEESKVTSPPVPLNKRHSYMSGSGAVPPIPGMAAPMRKSATFDSAGHSTMAPPPPGAPPVPPHAPPVAADISEEETTGYEADEDTQDVSETDDGLRKRDSDLSSGIPPHTHVPPPPPNIPSSPTATTSHHRLSRPPPPPPPAPTSAPPAAPRPPLPPHHVAHEESSGSFGGDDEQDTDEGFVDYGSGPGAAAAAAASRAPPPPPPPVKSPPLPARHSMSGPPSGSPQHIHAVPPPAPPSMQSPPPPPAPPSSVPSQPSLPVRRTTGSSRDSVDSGFRRRQSTDLRHQTSGSSSAINSAHDIDLQVESSDWWLQATAVPPEIARHSKDWLYEVEESQNSKRGGRTLVTKDIYVLYPDYSQTSISLQYDLHSPHETLQVEQKHNTGPTEPRQDQLEEYSVQFGSKVISGVQKAATTQSLSPAETVAYVISQIPGALPAIGGRAFGAIVYQNMANSSVKQHDEIRPGDVAVIRHAKFQGHKGGLHQKYSNEVGMSSPYVGVIQEWDGAKKKLRVIEQQAKKIKQESFRLQDLKSGEIVVYRVVGRSYVGWE